MSDQFLVSDLYFNPNVCHICKTTTNSIKKCKGCNMISYCSQEHQKLHWKNHKPLCLCMQQIKKELGNYYYTKFEFSLLTDSKGLENKPSVQDTCSAPIREVNIRKFKSQTSKELGIQFSNMNVECKLEANEDANSKDTHVDSDNANTLLTACSHNDSNKNLKDLHKREWTQYKYKLLNLTETLLDRNLRNIEKDIILNPKCCFVCKQDSMKLITCESCLTVNYCHKHLNNKSHAAYCEQFSLLLKINKYIVDKYSPNTFAYIENISNYLEPYNHENDLEFYELSEYTSYYRTLVYLIKFLKFSRQSLTIHVVGASEYECSPYSVYLWENIFHRLHFLKYITLVFIGFHVTEDSYNLKLCQACVDSGRKIIIECHQTSYHEYADSKTYSALGSTEKVKKHSDIQVDLIIAFNAGFHEYEDQSTFNTWTNTLECFLSSKHVPVAFTAYTKEEIRRDTLMIQNLAQDVRVGFLLESEQNEEASEKPRIDPEEGVYFLNKYISCFYCK